LVNRFTLCTHAANGWVAPDFWLENWEKHAVTGFRLKNPLEGYRRLTLMMLGADIVFRVTDEVYYCHGVSSRSSSASECWRV
jgi:hypothetical protein